jgi:hypothetical protein
VPSKGSEYRGRGDKKKCRRNDDIKVYLGKEFLSQ